MMLKGHSDMLLEMPVYLLVSLFLIADFRFLSSVRLIYTTHKHIHQWHLAHGEWRMGR